MVLEGLLGVLEPELRPAWHRFSQIFIRIYICD
jgi:hypothetical protein